MLAGQQKCRLSELGRRGWKLSVAEGESISRKRESANEEERDTLVEGC